MEEIVEDSLINNFSEMSVKLDIFEGPLDLLLFLIRKNELDIYDIPIAEVTKQYMGVIRSMKNLSLEIAGEYFVMAANLMYIKSRMLLPTDERLNEPQNTTDDDDIDPRWQLVEQLLEYKKIKHAAQSLEELIDNRQNYLDRYVLNTEKIVRPLKKSDKMEIWGVFNLVLRRLAEKLIEGQIYADNITVSDRMEYVMSIKEKNFTFSSLFENENVSINILVATFLAILELTRLKRLKLVQNGNFDEIHCQQIAPEDIQEEDSQNLKDWTWEGDTPEETQE